MNGRRLKINQEVEEGRCRCCAALRGANSCYFPNPRDGVRAPCLMCPSGNLGLEGRVRLKMSFPNEVGFRFSIIFCFIPDSPVPFLWEQLANGFESLPLPGFGFACIFRAFQQHIGTV